MTDEQWMWFLYIGMFAVAVGLYFLMRMVVRIQKQASTSSAGTSRWAVRIVVAVIALPIAFYFIAMMIGAFAGGLA